MTNTEWGQQQPDHVVSIEETKLKKRGLLKIYSVSAFIFLGLGISLNFIMIQLVRGLLRR